MGSLRLLVTSALAGVALAGCMSDSMKAVDGWLTAYAGGDGAGMRRHTWPEDRPLLDEALLAMEASATSTLALALPPRPLEHEVVELEEIEADDRHVILTRITMKNPLRNRWWRQPSSELDVVGLPPSEVASFDQAAVHESGDKSGLLARSDGLQQTA